MSWQNRIVGQGEVALRRDHARCRLCGFAVVVHLHHIVHKKDGGKDVPENLITLCPNHHAMVHRGFIADEVLRRALEEASPIIMEESDCGLWGGLTSGPAPVTDELAYPSTVST